MGFSNQFMTDLLYGMGRRQRFTQDSPLLPGAWIQFGLRPKERVTLLVTPHVETTPGEIHTHLLPLGRRDENHPKLLNLTKAKLAYNQSTLIGDFSFQETLACILPLSARHWKWGLGIYRTAPKAPDARLKDWIKGLDASCVDNAPQAFLLLIGLIVAAQKAPGTAQRISHRYGQPTTTVAAISDEMSDFAKEGLKNFVSSPYFDHFLPSEAELRLKAGPGPVWEISHNRTATTATCESVRTVKADAAINVFNISCKDIVWAVVDTGIDASHPAFRREDQPSGTQTQPSQSRIKASYDFSRIRSLIASPQGWDALSSGSAHRHLSLIKRQQYVSDMVKAGRMLDWHLLAPLLEVPYDNYQPHRPKDKHGTHVAGILAGKAVVDDKATGTLQGVCPDIQLLDIRVFNELGESDEFTILCALQFLRHLNGSANVKMLHGVNLSLSLHHEVKFFACGRTPICVEVERMVNSGVVVVAAAGNGGYHTFVDHNGKSIDQYTDISITDPGNAEAAITVGATHRSEPHTYGVSYFSSRGPTGDGRNKPDLVAPGEKILAPIPDGDSDYMDGTSMAAPHVSGAAAMLLARHRELIGQPSVVKDILCRTATDLGRKREFQGHGLVDILRALQSI